MNDKQTEKLAAALQSLDPRENGHWTRDGRPQPTYLCRKLKMPVTRQDIESLDPHLNRDLAKQRDDAEVAALLSGGKVAEPSPEVGALLSGGKVAEPSPEVGAFLAESDVPIAAVTSVLEIPLADLVRDPNLLDAAAAELDGQYQALLKQRDEIQAQMDAVNYRSQMVSRYLQQVRPTRETFAEQVKAVQAHSAAVRAQRSERARRFLAAGTTAAEVRRELDPRAPIDAALNAKRGGIGTRRPTPQVPAHLSA